MFGRNRNGSASGNRSGVGTGPTATPGNSQPASPAVATHKKKKGGFLSIFGCCGVPDSANGLDGGEEPLPSHKVEKIPHRPTTASRRPITPSEQPTNSKTQLYEKEHTQPAQEVSKSGKRVSGASSHDQSTVGERDESRSRPPLSARIPSSRSSRRSLPARAPLLLPTLPRKTRMPRATFLCQMPRHQGKQCLSRHPRMRHIKFPPSSPGSHPRGSYRPEPPGPRACLSLRTRAACPEGSPASPRHRSSGERSA